RQLLETLGRYLPSPPTAKAVETVAVTQAGIEGGERIVSTFHDDIAFMPLVREYADGLAPRLHEIRAAHGEGDLVRLASLAHQTKGAGGMYGFPKLSEAAAALEEALQKQQSPEVVAKLIAEIERTTTLIQRGIE